MSADFSRRPVIALAVLGGVSLLVLLFLIVDGSSAPAQRSNGPDTFSRSALGHLSLVELLREVGFGVHVNRTSESIWDPDESVLVFAEPTLDGSPDTLRRRLEDARTVLIVLPKRTGVGEGEDGWLEHTMTMDGDDVAAVLTAIAIGVDGYVVRLPEDGPTPAFSAFGATQHEIDLLGAQLVNRGVLEGIVTHDDGILLGKVPADDEHPGRRIFVLSDPDVIANHGLHRADNAAFTCALFEFLGGGRESAIVFDETLHGFRRSRALWSELLRFPLVLTLAHGLIVLAFVLWAGMGRFGPPETAPPVLGAGRRTLVENTAELLVHGGHVAFVVGRYMDHAVEHVARAYHAPAGLDPKGRLAFVTDLAERRGTRDRPERLATDVRALRALRRGAMRRGGARRALGVAVRIHRWKEEVLHGPEPDHRDRKPSA